MQLLLENRIWNIWKKMCSKELKKNNWMIFCSEGNHEVIAFSELNFRTSKYLKDKKEEDLVMKS